MYSKGELPEKGTRPYDIPSYPYYRYKNKGWVSWGDWLGPSRVALRYRWRPFEEAREFVRNLGLQSKAEWRRYSRGELQEKGTPPDDIPKSPHPAYKDRGWISWADWLGWGPILTAARRRRRDWRPFEEAREFARNLGLSSSSEWAKYSKGELPGIGTRPKDIPSIPARTYKGRGWINWDDWLGRRCRDWRPFEEARKFVRNLKLSSRSEWAKYAKGELPEIGTRPKDIPSRPTRTYKGRGWINWDDWLGTELLPFEEAREFARSLGLETSKEWWMFCKGGMPEKGTLPGNIPSAPSLTFNNHGWINWANWLGTDTIWISTGRHRRDWVPFKEARKFVRSLKLSGRSEWVKYAKGKLPEIGTRPKDIPSLPHKTYMGRGWTNYPDWLGTSRKRRS